MYFVWWKQQSFNQPKSVPSAKVWVLREPISINVQMKCNLRNTLSIKTPASEHWSCEYNHMHSWARPMHMIITSEISPPQGTCQFPDRHNYSYNVALNYLTVHQLLMNRRNLNGDDRSTLVEYISLRSTNRCEPTRTRVKHTYIDEWPTQGTRHQTWGLKNLLGSHIFSDMFYAATWAYLQVRQS